MDRFLTYFQRYILSKPPLSMDIEFQISDVFEQLRPELHRSLLSALSMSLHMHVDMHLSKKPLQQWMQSKQNWQSMMVSDQSAYACDSM